MNVHQFLSIDDAEATVGPQRTDFTYNGTGRRASAVESLSGVTTSTKRWIWCGSKLCEERAANGVTVLTRFFQRGIEDAGAALYQTFDHLGSTRDVVASGAGVRRYDYDPYGNRTIVSGTVDVAPSFTGHYFHSASGLHLTANRSYASEIARWTSPDPLGFVDGPNLFAYVEGNPLARIDPFGLEWVGRICCDGKGGFKVCWNPNASGYDNMVRDCMEEHEEQHITDLSSDPSCSDLCQDKKKDYVVKVSSDTSKRIECSAYKTEMDCLKKKGPWPRVRDRQREVEGYIRDKCGPERR